MSKSTIPNIFEFATSELSQDAFFAWLIKCAKPEYLSEDMELCTLGQSFIKLLTGDDSLIIKSVEVGRQWKNIDIWVEVNDDTFITIEDKTETSEHDEQLMRYKEIVLEEFKGKRDKLHFVYLKTGNEPQSVLAEISNSGYRVILRNDMLRLLNLYKGNHVFVNDYKEHLQEIENETQEFKILPVDKWRWYAWQGFYQEINKHIDLASWNYVANPSGGFLGAFWYFIGVDDNLEMYLQFEEQKLCFKICCDYDNKSEIRNRFFEILMTVKENYFADEEIHRPQRFGSGEYMTIAIVDSEFLFGPGLIDIQRIVSKLHRYEQLVDMCCEQYEKEYTKNLKE